MKTPYPKPGPVGGTLIRQVMAAFKHDLDIKVPVTSPVLIAVSGGVDSMTLAHLLCKYGRRLIPREYLTLLHFDHGWRPASKTLERQAVQNLANRFEVGFCGIELESPKKMGINAEAGAHQKRQREFLSLAGPLKTFRYVLTAHHQGDLVETLVWRFFRGEWDTHKEGVLANYDPVLRPLLKVKKTALLAYAQEERLTYFEDPGNTDRAFMRARLRTQIFPELAQAFPGFMDTVAAYAGKRPKR